MNKSVAPRRTDIESWNADRSRLLVAVGSPSQAGALYFFDTGGNRMRRIAWQNDGASYGGYAAMRAAQRGDGYVCAVSYAGVSDLAAMKRYDGQFLGGKTRSDWLKKQAPDFAAVSPRFGAASFSTPILLVHGCEDKRVPVKQSQMMASALREAGKPFEYLEQPLADHHFTRSEDRLEFLKRMKAFLDRYNPA